MSAAPAYSYRYNTIVMSERFNNLVIPVAIDGKVGFIPIAFICDYLGIQKRNQADALKADGRFPTPDVLREVPFNLSGAGWRGVLAIRRDKFGLWILGIDPQRVKPELRGLLEDFQDEVGKLLDRLLFGAKTVPAERRGIVEVSGQREYRFPCEECGAMHVLIDDGKGNVQVMREVR